MSENTTPRPPQQPTSSYQPQNLGSDDYMQLDQAHLYTQQPSQPANPYGSSQPEQSTSKKAIISLVLGIIAILSGTFLPFIGLIGIVLGIIGIVLAALSFKDIKRSAALKGKGLGIAGLVCSIIGLVATLFVQGSLIFFTYFLMTNPDLQYELQNEINSDPELSQMLEQLNHDN